MMSDGGAVFDPQTEYRIEIQGEIDMDWLRSFVSSTEISKDQTAEFKGTTMIRVHTDQSGVVGLIRRIHGLGLTILKMELITRKEE